MDIKRTWIVAGATLAMAGFAGAGIAMASDDVEVRDPQHAPVVQLTGDGASKPAASANTADSPGEPGYVAPAPAPAPVAADSGDSPAPAPVKPARSDDSAGSAASAD